MGWSSGSAVAREVIDVILKHDSLKNTLTDIFVVFLKHDCDTLDDCVYWENDEKVRELLDTALRQAKEKI